MYPFAISSIVLMCIGTTAGWTTTNYWQTSHVSGYKSETITSIAVYPTGTASATSTNTSTSLFTSGGFSLSLTVYDLFFASSAAVCTLSHLEPCGPTPAISRTSGSITTTYWAPVLIANPTSCTKTSFEYTTASTVIMPSLWISDAAEQATQSIEALLVTTYVKTLSVNMGGQAVTTTVCDVYLRSEAVAGVTYVSESTILTECMDPRDYSCRQLSSAISEGAGITGTKTTCDRTGQTYPPTTVVAGAASPTKSSGANGPGFHPSAWAGSLAIPGLVGLWGFFY